MGGQEAILCIKLFRQERKKEICIDPRPKRHHHGGTPHVEEFTMGHDRLATPDLERIFQGETVSGLSEWQLLTRYLEHRDELAFAALVARHGPMVMGTCRRMLARGADAEDAFQATFLVLVRRARSLGPRDAIGPWLHGVAARVSMRARSQAARRMRVEPSAGELAAVPDWTTSIDGELAAILDQEVNRLPAKYRSPIVLCYLQGLTHEEAARQLNWPLGSVKGRLARARDLLRSRLLRRGIGRSTALLGAPTARESSAAFDRATF
jgi:RNA polymerase sigma factor (sigma-70 family)